jgi:hypothetical protein
MFKGILYSWHDICYWYPYDIVRKLCACNLKWILYNDDIREKGEKEMTYFAQIVDAWDCELDFIGPFYTEDQATTAAFDKWDGEDGCRVVIIKRLPAFVH